MKSSADLYVKIITALLILLWVYTGSSKLLDFNDFHVQLALQDLPVWTKRLLLYTLPGVEMIVALLLVFKKTELTGYWASLVLMAAFTAYVGFAVFGGFAHIPCSCGGVIKSMGWTNHFLFNVFFLILTSAGLILHYRKGGISKV